MRQRRILSCAHFQVFGLGVFCPQHQRCVIMNISDIVQEETCLAGMTTVRRAVELSTRGLMSPVIPTVLSVIGGSADVITFLACD